MVVFPFSENYDFNFQSYWPYPKFNPKSKIGNILPGDELRLTCQYDTRGKGPYAVVGGLESSVFVLNLSRVSVVLLSVLRKCVSHT